ncbi:copper ion binding protein [Paenibacillus oceani]|uniref:Heavy-metal-associated domain-containing protein n=1 Tax=Paenibacillus oceani TaxID=2772510 RepID=A0A927GZ34_9BACL|nr:copper ion binding protein [Paenibacillus oceani]MBD2861677.1 heavy-metal-associated domain-containing protein [Paenibacillus oceani]
MQNVTLQVEGMSCNHCVNSIEGAMKTIGATAKVDLAGKSVTVQFDESKLSLDTVKTTIEDQGYDVV